jgi:hypothetical protein
VSSVIERAGDQIFTFRDNVGGCQRENSGAGICNQAPKAMKNKGDVEEPGARWAACLGCPGGRSWARADRPIIVTWMRAIGAGLRGAALETSRWRRNMALNFLI